MRWIRSHRADAEVVPLADRHYNRQKIGSPQFAPPGRCLVLKTAELDAFWITSWPFAEYVRHAWAGAWVCSAFRNESAHLSSELIREAVAATLDEYGPAPALGMITFVDTTKTRKKRDPGRCYLRAGFKNCGMTKGGLVALQLLPDDMPKPARPRDDNRGQASLFAAAPELLAAAVVAAHLEGPDHGMQWIYNTLAGPGHLPDLDDARAIGGAQAMFDAEMAEHKAFRVAHPAPAIQSPKVGDCTEVKLSVESRDIGEWSDDHPLNKTDTADEFARNLFGKKEV